MFAAKHNLNVGIEGEKVAGQYLIKKGWVVLFKNIKRKGDEIDIIARDPKGTLVFCEVKTMAIRACATVDTTCTDGPAGESLMPEDNMTAFKRRKMARGCEFFARSNPDMVDQEKGWRMDLIAVDLQKLGPAGPWSAAARYAVAGIRHYENI